MKNWMLLNLSTLFLLLSGSPQQPVRGADVPTAEQNFDDAGWKYQSMLNQWVQGEAGKWEEAEGTLRAKPSASEDQKSWLAIRGVYQQCLVRAEFRLAGQGDLQVRLQRIFRMADASRTFEVTAMIGKSSEKSVQPLLNQKDWQRLEVHAFPGRVVFYLNGTAILNRKLEGNDTGRNLSLRFTGSDGSSVQFRELKVAEISEEIQARLKKFTANPGHFSCQLSFAGSQDKPFYNLELHGNQLKRDSFTFSASVELTAEEQQKLLQGLVREGFLSTGILGQKKLDVPDPSYVFTLSTKDYQQREVIDLNQSPFTRLDLLSEIISDTGHPAAIASMQRLLGRISGFRKAP